MKLKIEDLVAAYAAGKYIRYSTASGFAELTTVKLGFPAGQPRYGFRHSSHQITAGKPLSFQTQSPEESIRAALITPRNDGSNRTLEVWDKVAEITVEAPAAPIPLGPNRTRDGREARVVCNDREGGLPVIALFKSSSGFEVISHHFADGAVSRDGTGLPSDLVGHLPPEPRKPREFQAVVLQDGTIADVRSAHPQMLVYAKLETITVREVLP